MIDGHRSHPTYWAFLLHRVSGLVLALFLPVHFYVLALAIEGDAGLDGFLRWSAEPPVKVAEAMLIVLLAAHMTGGLRVLAVEFLPWRDRQKTLVAVAGGLSVLAGLVFLLVAA